MRQLKYLSIISIATAFVLPAVERSSTLIKTWHPVQVSRFDSRDAENTGFSNVVARNRIIADHFELELSGQTTRLSIRAEETAAPPGSVWQPLPDSQWDNWHRDVVVKAWKSALDLATRASGNLLSVMEGSASYKAFWDTTIAECKFAYLKKNPSEMTAASSKQMLNCYRHFLAAHNLAYGQYFGADPENIQLIQQNFQKIAEQTENLGAPGRNNLNIYLTWGPTLTDVKKNKNECAKENGVLPQAMVIPASLVKELVGSTVPMEAQVIHFCPAFFDVGQLGRIETQMSSLATADDAKKANICRLDKLDSTTRAMLHEFTHLPWTLNTNLNNKPKDTYGYLTVIRSSVAVLSNTPAQTPKTKSFSSKNADNYAWMAIYDYFNSVAECKNIRYDGVNAGPGTCNADVWPKDVPKLVKTKWNSYPGNDPPFPSH